MDYIKYLALIKNPVQFMENSITITLFTFFMKEKKSKLNMQRGTSYHTTNKKTKQQSTKNN